MSDNLPASCETLGLILLRVRPASASFQNHRPFSMKKSGTAGKAKGGRLHVGEFPRLFSLVPSGVLLSLLLHRLVQRVWENTVRLQSKVQIALRAVPVSIALLSELSPIRFPVRLLHRKSAAHETRKSLIGNRLPHSAGLAITSLEPKLLSL